MVIERINNWLKEMRTDEVPENIMYYCDGVSEGLCNLVRTNGPIQLTKTSGQFSQVVETEVAPIKQA